MPESVDNLPFVTGSATKPLTGVRVVEVSGRLSCRIAAAILADLGATVVRVQCSTFPNPEDDSPTGNPEALAAALDRGKDVRLRSDIKTLSRLGPADVLLTSGQGAAWRDEWLEILDPEAGVSVHLSPFGIEGPYAGMPGTEINLLAYGAIAAYVGEADREPIAPPIMLAAYQAGVMAAISTIAGLRRSGLTRVDLAEADVLATNHVAGLYSLSALVGDIPRRAGHRKPNPYPFTILPCKDGWVSIVFLSGRQWAKLLKVMGDPAWGRDPRYADRRVNGVLHVEELDRLLSAWLCRHTKAELRDIAVTHGLPIAPVQTIDDLLVDRQLASRGYFVSAKIGASVVKTPGLPFHLEELAASTQTRDKLRKVAASCAEHAAGPLTGLRVLDLGWVLSGPMVGQLMADLGADVIKVESRAKLDSSRIGLPLIDMDPAADKDGLLLNLMPHFNNVNRGKRSAVLDLGVPAGQEVLARLVADADLVIENFGAGSLERLGLPPEWFAAIQPSLVLVRISICGQQGPEASLRGYAAQSTAFGGLDALCRYRGESPVGLITLNLGDVSAALFAAVGALAALHRVDKGGSGSIVDTSMMESAAFHLGPLIVARQLSPEEEPPTGNDHARFSPHGMFATAEDDEWISIAVRDDAEWRALRKLIGAPTEADQIALGERRARRAVIAEWITSWTSARTADEAFNALRAAGIPAAPAYSIEGLLVDRNAHARESIINVEHHILGSLPIYGTPLRAAPPIARVRGRSPDLGEHTVQLIGELGIVDAELDRLSTEGAFEGMQVRP